MSLRRDAEGLVRRGGELSERAQNHCGDDLVKCFSRTRFSGDADAPVFADCGGRFGTQAPEALPD